MTKFLKNADVTGYISQTSVTSSLLKTDSNGKLVAATAGTDYQAPTTALLPTGGTAGQILSKIDATNYNTQWIDNFAAQLKHEVKLGATLAKGAAVYVSSANGTNMIVSAASNASEATSSKTLGLLETGGVTNDLVKVVTEGLLAGLDTSTATAGDPVWLGVNGALIFGLANKPVAPAHLVFIGIVTRVQSVNGEIFVKVQNGFELNEIHDVSISSLANNQTLVWESATSLWKNKTIAAALGYTPADDSAVVKLTGDQTVAGVKTFTSVVNAPTLSLNGGVLSGNNIVSMRSNPTGGQFRIEKSDGSLSAYPFYIGADGTALAYYYNAAGALKVLLHTDNTSYFGNSLSVGYSTYATTSYMLDVNGTARFVGAITGTSATFTNPVTIGNYDGQALKLQSATSTGSSYLRFYNSAAASRGYLGLFWNGTSDYMVFDAGALEMNFGSSNKFTFTGGGTAIFSGAITANSDVTISTGSIKMYSVQNAAGQYRYIGTEYAAGNGNNKAEIRFGIDGSDTRTKITLHTANGGGQINEVLGAFASGQLKFNNYTASSSFSGTAAGYLAFDSSGNVITVAGVAATDNTKLPLAGGTLTGALQISMGYPYIQLNDTIGSPTKSAYIQYGVTVGGAGASGGGYLLTYSQDKPFAWSVGTSQGIMILDASGNLALKGVLQMSTSGTSYISMGRFPNSVSNSGEAWLGRASDRSTGTMTVQLGGGSNASFFEVVDYGWTTVTLKVGMNDFSYKGNAVIHAGNIGSYAISSSGGAISGDSYITFGPNSTWASYLRVGGNGRTVSGGNYASVVTTNGNLHIDGGSDKGTYINYYAGTAGIAFGTGASGVAASVDSSGNIWKGGTIGSGTQYVYNSGTWAINISGTAGGVAWGNVSSKPSNIMYYQGFTLDANTMDSNSTGFTYSSNAPYTGPVARFSTGGGYDLWINATYGGGGTQIAYRTRNGDAGTFNAWRNLLNDANYNTWVGGLTTGNSWTGQNYFVSNRNTTSDSPPLQAYSNNGGGAIMSFHRAGAYAVNFGLDSDNVMRIGGWSAGANRWQLDMSGNMSTAGNITSGGLIRVGASTNLYLDTNYGCSVVGLYSAARFQGVFSMGDAYKLAIDGTSPGNLYGISWSHPNAGGQATYLNDHGMMVMVNGVTYSAMSSNIWARGRITANENVYSNGGWFYSYNNAGWYNETYGQGLRQSKGNVSYGNVINVGENYNGWAGYNAQNTFTTTFMTNSGGTHGFYQESGDGWTAFYNKSYQCWGLGTDATDPAYSLHIIKYGGSNTGWIIWSDRRIKENIKTIDNALDKVLSLRGVYYNKIDDPNKERCVGYIAQEAMEVVPELVVYSEELDIYNMNYGPMVSMLTEAVKEHHTKTVAQQAEIDTLKEQVQTLLNYINNGI